jgi:hypothetical protein
LRREAAAELGLPETATVEEILKAQIRKTENDHKRTLAALRRIEKNTGAQLTPSYDYLHKKLLILSGTLPGQTLDPDRAGTLYGYLHELKNFDMQAAQYPQIYQPTLMLDFIDKLFDLVSNHVRKQNLLHGATYPEDMTQLRSWQG